MSPRVHFRALPLAALLLAVVGAAPAFAQGPKLAYIDTERVLLESNTGKAALAELKTLQQSKEAELKAKQDEAAALKKRLDEGRLSLAEDTIADLSQQLEEKGIELRRLQDDATRQLNKRKDEVLAKIDQKVMPIINQYGKEQGFTMIFRKFESGLIYADQSVDITAAIIQRVDATASAPGG